jgi:sirohydrochlorin cobaltochelatase
LREAIVLFAHGSRDADWAKPFERIAALLKRALPEREVRLAYLEHMTPTLADSLAGLPDLGVRRVQVVPLFFGLGGHLKQDLPRLVAAADRRLEVRVEPPLGEQPAIIEAIAEAIARGARASR